MHFHQLDQIEYSFLFNLFSINYLSKLFFHLFAHGLVSESFREIPEADIDALGIFIQEMEAGSVEGGTLHLGHLVLGQGHEVVHLGFQTRPTLEVRSYEYFRSLIAYCYVVYGSLMGIF